jgi:predicted DNA-binding protein
MIRTQIQLTEEQSERLKAAAARRGVSMAELIRQSIDAFLARSGERSPEDAYRRAAQAAGKHRSGLHDVAARHDEYLNDGYSK